VSGASESISRFALVIDVEDSLVRGRLSIQRRLSKVCIGTRAGDFSVWHRGERPTRGRHVVYRDIVLLFS